MSIRLRRVDGRLVALCAARSVEKDGDIYLDDSAHYALAQKFTEDFQSEGFNLDRVLDDEAAALRAREESNNPARDWWDREYGQPPQSNPPRPEPQEMPPSHVVDFAVQVSGWSPCRSKRGVVIFSGDDLIQHGYNYKPRGFDCDGSAECKATCRGEAIHAEQQALLAAGRQANGAEMLHVKTVDGRLVPSGGPSCVQCSKLALVTGVAAMWLYHEDGWRRYPAAEFHRLSLAAQTPLAERDQLREALRTLEQEMERFEVAADKAIGEGPDEDATDAERAAAVQCVTTYHWRTRLSALLAAAEAPGEGR